MVTLTGWLEIEDVQVFIYVSVNRVMIISFYDYTFAETFDQNPVVCYIKPLCI